MLKPLRVLETGLASGRWNTALSAALLQSRGHAGAGDSLRLYRFTPCVLLGQNQEVASNAGAPRDVEVARRITGGGAVYMSPSMLAWDFVTRFVGTRGDMSARICSAIAQALKRLGWGQAHFVPPNDIQIAGRKVSGAAAASHGRVLLHQGTLLLRDEREAMARCLGIPLDALRKHITSLDAHAAVPADEAFSTAITDALADAFALTPVASVLTPGERSVAEVEFEKEVGRDAYVFLQEAATSGGSQ